MSSNPAQQQTLICVLHVSPAAGGIVHGKRAAFLCSNPSCKAAVWQQPEDFVAVGAWPASLDAAHCRYAVATLSSVMLVQSAARGMLLTLLLRSLQDGGGSGHAAAV